jgi:hypothetical protein
MKVFVFVVLIAVLSFAYVKAQGNPGAAANDPALALARVAIEKLKTEYEQMKAAGKVDDKKLIESYKSAINIMQTNKDKASAEAQTWITKHIAEAQTKIKAMETSGKFDEAVFAKRG